MKKFIFTACLTALIALVPAVITGYLYNAPDASSHHEHMETAGDASAHRDDLSMVQLVRTF